MNSRLDTLFNLAGITGKIKTGDENINECLKENVDYEVVHKNLQKIREESYDYLKKALEDKESTDFK